MQSFENIFCSGKIGRVPRSILEVANQHGSKNKFTENKLTFLYLQREKNCFRGTRHNKNNLYFLRPNILKTKHC
jgi:hypothetical protein